MDKFLESFLSTDLLTESVKQELAAGVDKLLSEARDEATAAARKELGEQYKADIARLVEAMDVKINDAIADYAKSTLAEKKQARLITAKASKAIAEADKRAKARMNKVLEQLSARINTRLEAELKPIYEDREIERTANIRKLREMDLRDKERYEKFVENGAKALEQIIETKLGGFMKNIKSDLDYARQNEFGRKIFEAFSDVFEHDFAARDTMISKLSTKLKESQTELSKVKTVSAKKIKQLSEDTRKASTAHRKLMEKTQRASAIDKMLSSLKGEARTQMRAILEAAPTDKLESVFKRNRSVVTESITNRKDKRSSRDLTETTLKTGRSAAIFEPGDADQDIDMSRLRRLVRKETM